MRPRKALLIVALCVFASGAAFAKLPSPPLTDEQKAKAEETKAKAAASAKRDVEALVKAQDRVADRYVKAQKATVTGVKPAPPAASGAAAVNAKK